MGAAGCLLSAALALGGASSAQAEAPPAATTPAGTTGAAILVSVAAMASPTRQAQVVKRISAYTPLTGDGMVLPILDTRDVAGRLWLKVRISGRPNGMVGWIQESAAIVIPLPWTIDVDLSARKLTASRGGQVVRTMRVVVGAPSTPTPTGHFFIVEKTRLRASWSPRGWALSTSAFSNVLRHFEGGVGQVAIHASGSLPEAMGTASSHGCVRARDADAAWLAGHIPSGTSLNIGA